MFGARCTKYQLEPAPAPSVDDHALERQLVRAGEGHGLGAGADDAGAHDLVGGLGGLAGARRAEVLDGLAHGGEHRARALRRPRGRRPHMMASVPFCAPSTPPLTGASRKLHAARRRGIASAQRAVSALTVEQSMTSAPVRETRAPGASMTARTSASAETQITTASSRVARSRRAMAGAAQPSSAASACALSALRFQTACEQPGLDGDFSPWEHPWHRDLQSRRAS